MPIYVFHLVVRYWVKEEGIYFGIFPKNDIIYYLLIFAFASICVFVFSSKPIVKIYDFAVDGSYKLFSLFVEMILNFVGIVEKWLVSLMHKVTTLLKKAT